MHIFYARYTLWRGGASPGAMRQRVERQALRPTPPARRGSVDFGEQSVRSDVLPLLYARALVAKGIEEIFREFQKTFSK